MKFPLLVLTFILVLGETISMSISSIGSGICCINSQCYSNCNGISCINNICTSSSGQPLQPATPEQIQQAQQEANAVLSVVLPLVGNILNGVNTLVGNIGTAVSGIGPAVTNMVTSILKAFGIGK